MPRTASANGKVILFGEYAVLSGTTGYAVALKDFTLCVSVPDTLETEDLNSLLNTVTIESNIPQGSGLGSSAALSVALTRALKGDNESDVDLFHKAKLFEDELHGGSSGIDTFTVLSGGLCSISSCNTFTKLPALLLQRLKRFKFSLIDTNTSRSVREIKSRINKTDLDEFLPISREISQTFQHKLETDQLQLPDMVDLFNRAQSALVNLKVSTPLIDSITATIKNRFPLVGVKITGAGGGGCLLLVHDGTLHESVLTEALAKFENVKLWYDIQFND